jgi:LacI family transcriptional regulator
MTHRFPIKEIAAQSGLSTATIDRALNGRAHVSPQTNARVAAAIAELEGQEAQLAARGRRLFVDVVVEAPERFIREIRRATQTVLPKIAPVVLRTRFETHEVMSVDQTVAVLERIAKRGSDGVCLKSRDVPKLRRAVAQLIAKGIPVVTIFTDSPDSGRLAYTGLDNRRAGQTAGRLIARQAKSGVVLATRSRHDFQGEGARLDGLRAGLAEFAPDIQIYTLQNAAGLNLSTARLVEETVAGVSALAGVYSMGGGNTAIHNVLRRLQVLPTVYVAHDLDEDNLALLESNALDYVLYHDLAQDMERAFRHIVAAHRLTPAPVERMSDIQIILPDNVPSHLHNSSG